MTHVQEEADTCFVLSAQYVNDHGYPYFRLKIPDSDVFYILIFNIPKLANTTVLLEMGVDNKKITLTDR